LLDSEHPPTRSSGLTDTAPNPLRLAREPPREACGIVELSTCFGKRFARLVRDDLGEVFLVLADQGVPSHEELGAGAWVDELVFLKGGVCCLHGGVDIFG